MVFEAILDLLRPYRDVIRPGFYLLFAVGTLVAFSLSHRDLVKKTYLAGFLAVILVITLVGTPMLPIVDMHKFADPTDEQFSVYEIRIVDQNGTELRYDTRAVPPVMGSRTSSLGDDLANNFDRAEQREMGAFLLTSAEDYRENVETGDSSRTSVLAPPRYVDEPTWTADQLAGVGEFQEIHVHRTRYIVTDDSTDVRTDSEQVALVIDRDGNVTDPRNT